MDNEVYSATMDLDTLPFEEKIDRVKKLYQNFVEEYKKIAGEKFDVRVFNIDKTKNEIAQIQEMWANMKKYSENETGLGFAEGSGGIWSTTIPEVMEETATFIESIEHHSETATQSVEEVAQATQDLGSSVQETKQAFTGFTPTIKKMSNDAKATSKNFARLGMTLLGVRSTYSLIRKAVNSALSSNEELANKMNAIWKSLGNALAPIVERLVNMILRAFTYLSIFIRTLSGGKIDLLAKTSDSAKSTAGSLKEANKYLAGFDELNNVDEQTGSGGSGGASISDPFADIEVDTTWADGIQAFGEWVKINWPLVIGLLAGTWLALQPCYSAFSLWEKTGIVLVIAGIAEGFKGIYDFVNGIKTGNLDLVSQGLKEIAIGIGLVSVGFLLLTEGMTGWFGIAIAIVFAFASYVVKHWDEIKEGFQILWDRIIEGVTQIRDWFVEKWNNISYAVSECWKSIKDNWEAMKQKISDGVTAVKDWFIEKWNNISYAWGEITKSMKDQWEGFKNKIKSGAEAIGGFFSGIWQGAKEMANNVIGYVESMINKAISGVNSLIRGLNRIHFTTPDWIPLIGGKSFGFNLGQINSVSLQRLDTGTNYVPSDQLAMIHQGEAVIPKKFNSQEYFGGNSEMAEKLDVLIEAVNNIDLQPYITVKDVGQASVKYQNSQYRLRGRSLVNG